MLLEAQALRLSGRPREALRTLAELGAGRGSKVQHAQFMKAQILREDLDQASRAARAYLSYLRRHPRGMFRREATFRAGQALLAAGNTEAGRRQLRRYLAQFPDGAHATLARQAIERR
jgi:TolA-binding protein